MKYESAEVRDVAKFIADPAWVMEQKADGIRCIARIDEAGTVAFLSHTGEPLKSGCAHHAPIAKSLAAAGLRSVTLDGEVLATGEFWIFDILHACGSDLRAMPLSTRRGLLDTITPALSYPVGVLVQARTTEAKQALWDSIVAAGAEGAVAKKLTSVYETGSRRSRDVLKLKITSTIDCVVVEIGRKGSESCVLGLYRDGVLTEVGKASLIGKAPVTVGSVVEVTFLGWYKAAMSQARIMRNRPDRTAESCEWSQLPATMNRAVVV